MPYVFRDEQGRIQHLQAEPSDHASEYLAADDSDLLEYLSRSKDTEAAKLALSDTDSEFARVTEDLIHLLVRKQVILFTDLPEVVRRKLLLREQVRECLRPDQPSILSDDETL